MRCGSESDRGIETREALDYQHLRERVGASPTPFLRKRDAEESELAEFTNHLARKNFLLVPFGGVRLDFALGKIGERLANTTLLLRHLKVHQKSCKQRITREGARFHAPT